MKGMKNYKEVGMAAVQQDGLALAKAAKKMKKDKEVVMAAGAAQLPSNARRWRYAKLRLFVDGM